MKKIFILLRCTHEYHPFRRSQFEDFICASESKDKLEEWYDKNVEDKEEYSLVDNRDDSNKYHREKIDHYFISEEELL